jgi:hypothetical protein
MGDAPGRVSNKRAGERPTNVPVDAADANGITDAERAILATKPISVKSTTGRGR